MIDMDTQNNNKQLAKEVEDLVANGETEKAMALLDGIVAAHEEAEAYYLRGRLKWKLGQKTEAMSDYNKAVAIDPKSPAATALEMANNVMDFYNHDMYNP